MSRLRNGHAPNKVTAHEWPDRKTASFATCCLSGYCLEAPHSIRARAVKNHMMYLQIGASFSVGLSRNRFPLNSEFYLEQTSHIVA